MSRTTFRGLPEFGLPLITPDDAAFPMLVEEIRSVPKPFGPGGDRKLGPSVILKNVTGRWIVAMTYVWRFTYSDGKTRAHWRSTFGSSTQMDVLAGRIPAPAAGAAFVAPGSKRLITRDGEFGDNSDVEPRDSAKRGGLGFGGGGGGRHSRAIEEDVTEVAFELDSVFLDDGLCAGPDQSGLFERLTQDLARQRAAAAAIAQALRNGFSRGQVFELLLPLARRGMPPPPPTQGLHSHALFLPMFANMAIRTLTDASDMALLEWFEKAAGAVALPLRRP